MLQHSPRSQFVKEIIMPITSIDKDNQIKEVLRRLHEDEEKWIYEKQKKAIYTIMNSMNSLICIFSIKEEKITLIMISVILNDFKMMIVVISYISLINDLEK